MDEKRDTFTPPNDIYENFIYRMRQLPAHQQLQLERFLKVLSESNPSGKGEGAQ